MTFHLLELLSSLVLRLNVQGLVEQGLVPLITSVSSYLLVQQNMERSHRSDPTFFIADETQEMHRVQSIRNQCLALISSLIEVFGDNAVQAVLLVTHNMIHQGKVENPWMDRWLFTIESNFAGEDNDDGAEEESKDPRPAMQEGTEPEVGKQMREA